MTNEKFMQIVDAQVDLCKTTLGVKSAEYDVGTTDRLHSFRAAAVLQNETPKQALAGMLCKHTVSIYDMCREGNYSVEKWSEKITDHINYLLLLRAMVEEDE